MTAYNTGNSKGHIATIYNLLLGGGRTQGLSNVLPFCLVHAYRPRSSPKGFVKGLCKGYRDTWGLYIGIMENKNGNCCSILGLC